MKGRTFETYVRTVLEGGAREAQRSGSATIEAEHLLLAIAAGPENASRELLRSAGLDHETIRDALRREFEQSLRTVGVSVTDRSLLSPREAAVRPSRMGRSAKLVFERGMAAAHGKNDARPEHLLLGVLELRYGTVPRTLELAGVDTAALKERARRSLSGESA
ncbi:Clp protease [Actinomadura spongiicola]|uniref:Clp protease n=1 Tax=Actinomadura spongiicola TaxID=2303421 RepID=A0A372GFJ6_9ACTN|nr:Clp protease N-terminal domain-containing protein [Actinomadura spongiicola]RFS84165.1 Clp protease [Actinomadura spongiicola]